ncbi:MAG TPA: DNA primase [Flavobacteriales bacterium]|nr:DNA primase [Flavobacteriales bacterium]
MIPQGTVDKIHEAARIEEIVQDFISLKKRGVNYVACCPFHNEKSPSFTVSPAKGLFKCFGCGVGGDGVNFVMRHEHMTYYDALKYVARKYNIEVEEVQLTPEQIALQNERETLYVVTSFAQTQFSNYMMQTDEGKSIGLNYFKERGFNNTTIEKFSLGFSPDNSRFLVDAAKKNGYDLKYLLQTGLVKEREGDYFDFFRDRVIFPVHNLTGRIIAFGGRTLKTDKKIPKYINSPETEIYSKSKTLYGMFQAKRGIIQKDVCYLVEGYTDVISMHQAGIENVVASSGTSLTTEQIKLIKRFTNNITILYDGDAAGIKASFRGIDMILEEGCNVKVVLFPDGDDPDSYSRKVSFEELQQYITTASQDFMLFKSGLLLKDVANDPVKKAELIKDIVHSISLIPDSIKRSIYIKECSALFEIAEQTLVFEMNKELRKKHGAKSNIPVNEMPVVESPLVIQSPAIERSEVFYQERELVQLLLNYSEYLIPIQIPVDDKTEEIKLSAAEIIFYQLELDGIVFEYESFAKIYTAFYSKFIEEGYTPQPKELLKTDDAELQQTITELISSQYVLSESWESKHRIYTRTELDKLELAVVNTLLSFKQKKVEQMIYKLQDHLKIVEDEDESNAILNEIKELLEMKKIFAGKLGRILTK